ncbi:conserved exported hypothetical protein [Mesorhizobium sp. ORS 3359]|nr:conserved exported hypothetical protein [Mesorhizobium sp. ORS 3359]
MTTKLDWVRLPTNWIRDRGLIAFRWDRGTGSGNTAALMVLIAVAHAADKEGEAKVTYDMLCLVTGLSRAKVSEGLKILVNNHIIDRIPTSRSTFRLVGFFKDKGWGKLPAKRLYAGDIISAFRDFTLRSIAELNALKLFLLIVAFRDNKTNVSLLSYGKITELAGIDRNRVRQALDVLTYRSLVHTERFQTLAGTKPSVYRLIGLDSFVHAGTRGEANMFADLMADATQNVGLPISPE